MKGILEFRAARRYGKGGAPLQAEQRGRGEHTTSYLQSGNGIGNREARGSRRIIAQPSTIAQRITLSASPRTEYYHVLTFRTAARFFDFMRIKIHPNYHGICGSCRHGSLAESVNGEFLVRCDWFGWNIPSAIVTCSRYDDRRMPSLFDMRHSAWILQTDEAKKTIGFVSNRQWRKSRDFRLDQFPDDDE